MNSKNKILLLVPASTAKGGIVNYFQALKGKFSLDVEFFERGARNWPQRQNKLFEFIRALKDIINFRNKINSNKFVLTQSSTSLGNFSVIRDGAFLYMAQKRGMKTIVFFRGWDVKFEKELEKKYLKIFKSIFFKCDAIIVLFSEFERKIRTWGYEGPIFLETTIADESLLKGFSLKNKIAKLKFTKRIRLLFLARVEKKKGIYEVIDAYIKLKKENPLFELIVAGDGFELDSVKEYVVKNRIKDVDFRGYIKGKSKSETFRDTDIYIFPSFHNEGLPNSVLEAMAFGIPIIATSVGGLKDILIDGETGYFISPNSPDDIVHKVKKIIHNRNQYVKISENNYIMAKKFITSNVIKRVEKIYKKIINEENLCNN